MDLNLQSTLISKNKSNFFSTKVKNNLDIAQHFKDKIKRMIRNNSTNIIKSYHVTQILLRKNEIIIGDKGGFILSINEKGTSYDLYNHQMEITALIQNEHKNLLISGSKDEIIKIYNFTQIDDPIELIGQKEPIIALELDIILNRLYSGGKSGNIFIWDVNTNTQMGVINTKVQLINCLKYSEKFDKLFVGQSNGIINAIELKNGQNKIKKMQSQQSVNINCMCISSKENILYTGSEEGFVEVIDVKQNQIIQTIEVNSQNIISINIYHDDYYLLITDSIGRILIQNVKGTQQNEIRYISRNGNSKAVIDNNEQFFYIAGIKDTIEKWDLKKEILVSRFQRNETPSLEHYNSFFNDNDNNKFYIYNEEGNLIKYEINDLKKKTHIINRTVYPKDWEIQKVDILSNQNIIYFCCDDLSIRLCSSEKQKLIGKLSNHDNMPMQLLYDDQKNILISIDKKGYIYTWDTKEFKLIKKHIQRTAINSEVIFAFLSESKKGVNLLCKDGSLIQIKINDGIIQLEEILNDEKISAYSYNSKYNLLLTGDLGGIIISTTIKNDRTLNSKELVDMVGEIKSIAQDNESKLMAFSTENLKIYIYSLEKEFNYDRLCSVHFQINHLFFSPNKNLLFACGPQGNLTTWDILIQNIPTQFKKLKREFVYSMACNTQNIFLGLKQGLEIFDIETKDRIKLVTEDYTTAYKLIMSYDGNTLYGSHENGNISVWDTEKFKRLEILLFYDQQIIDFCISEKDFFMGVHYQDKHTVIFNSFEQKIYSQFTTLKEMRTLKIIGDDLYVALELQTGEVGIYTLEGQIVSFVGKKSNFLKGYVETFDYNYLCLIYRDSGIQLWDVRKGEHIESYEKKDIVVNDFCLSQSKNTLYLISNRGQLLYMNLKTGKYYKEVELNNNKKTQFLQRSGQSLFYLTQDTVCQLKQSKTLSFFEKQYIKKAFVTYGRANSEKEFLKFFQIIKEDFDQSLFLQSYFNPFFSCALFNYQRALQQIQDNKLADYPVLNSQNQLSPLVLAIKLEHLNLAQIILIQLSKNPEDVLFSNDEMRTLLNSRYEFTHKYLQYFFIQIKKFTRTNIKVPLLSKLELPLKIDHDYKHYFTTEKYHELTRSNKQIEQLSQQDQEKLLKKVKNKLLGQDAKSEVSSNTENTSNYTYYDTNNNSSEAKQNKKKIVMWNATNFYRINGVYDFQQGTKESLEFLENYADSKSNDFILSNWKIIIDYKWEQIFHWLIPLSIINWAHSIFFFFLMIYPDKLFLLILDYFFLLIIFVYELISMIVSGPMQYITSLNNIFDIIILFLCCVVNYFTYTHEGLDGHSDDRWLSALQVFSLLVVYYRALTYLRIFKMFRNVIDMLVGVAKGSVSLLLIVALIVVELSIIFVKSNSGNGQLGTNLMHTINSVLGEITFELDDLDTLQWIVLVFTCIFLPVILLNFLIAKISNKYTELEELEEVTSYREKAELVAEIEYFYLLRNRSQKFLKEWQSNFFNSYFTKGYAFVAMNAQHLKNQQEDQDSSLQDKFEQFESTINNLHSSYLNDKLIFEQRKEIMNNMLENFNEQFEELKHQFVKVGNAIQEKNDEQNQKIEGLTETIDKFKNIIEDEKEYDIQLEKNIKEKKRGFW